MAGWTWTASSLTRGDSPTSTCCVCKRCLQAIPNCPAAMGPTSSRAWLPGSGGGQGGGPAILAGDFNLKPDAAGQVRLLSPIDADTTSYRDAWELANAGAPHSPTVGVHDQIQWPGPPFTWDFVFVSADL